MLCGSFSESKEKRLRLDDVESRAFIKTLDIWCGRADGQEMELHEVQQLASVADRFQITEVTSALEEGVMRQLRLEGCGEVLGWSGGCGMRRLEAAALKMAAERFEEFARTAGFMRMGGEALGSVLDDDRLAARNEEAVWEAVVAWKRGAAGEAGWRGVVGKVRFPLMGEEYLGDRVVGMVGGEDGEWMAGVVAEALRAKAARREGGRVGCSNSRRWGGRRWRIGWGWACGGRITGMAESCGWEGIRILYGLLFCAKGGCAAGLRMGRFGFGAGHPESSNGLWRRTAQMWRMQTQMKKAATLCFLWRRGRVAW